MHRPRGAGGGGPGDPNTPPIDPSFDPKPKKCKVSKYSEQVNAEVNVAFIEIGENAGFIERTFSDGTVTYTATDGASLGATGGFGGKLDLGSWSAAPRSTSASESRSTTAAPGPFQNAGEAAAMRRQLDEYLTEQPVLLDQVSVERPEGAAEAAVADREHD